MTDHEVHCYDGNSEILAGIVKKLMGPVTRKFKINDPDLTTKAIENIHTYNDKQRFIEAAKDCDVFLEVIIEDLKIKCNVLSDFLPQLPKNIIFWSNTNSLDINPMAEAGGRPDRSIGMNPVPMVSGVEIVLRIKTSIETINFTRQILLDMGKAPFLAPNISGFWINQSPHAPVLDAVRLLEQEKIRLEMVILV